MNKEQILQKDIAVAQSQRYPKKYGQLFHISNERANKKQAYIARAIGIVSGVADFLFISKRFNVATELKVPGNRYKVSSVRQQVWWGKIWEKKGTKKKPNVWRLCTTVEDALSCYEGNFKGMTIKQAEAFLNSVKTQTIKF